ncbi:peptidase [Streptomyces griseocarneus]|nr:peptidase [Streptomyces griseocarneus]
MTTTAAFTDADDPIRGISHPGGYWSRANTAEAASDILSPLCWSFWSTGAEWAARAGLSDMGLLPRSEIRMPTGPEESCLGCFYGRQALNVDFSRKVMASMPGADADDFERDLLGTVRPDAPHVPTSLRRAPVIALRAPATVLGHARKARALHTRHLAWWQDATSRPPLSPLDLLIDAVVHFRRSLRPQMVARSLITAVHATFTSLCAKAERPDLFAALASGFGGTPESDLAQLLWDVAKGRRAGEEITTWYGFHGVHEGNLTGISWREDPQALRTCLDSLAVAPTASSPQARAGTATRHHETAVTTVYRRLGRRDRAALVAVSAFAAIPVRSLQQTKEASLMAIDAGRYAARTLGRHLVDQGTLNDVEDAFFLTLDELRRPLGPGTAELAAFRRERHAAYRSLDLPVTFTGVPEPFPAREAEVTKGELTLTGISASPGTVTGPARVMHTWSDTPPNPGEILVCHATSPSWTPAFTVAGGVVTDVGSTASHSAIIARELGIPCVVNADDASRLIHTGDTLLVEGDTGTVRRIADTGKDG